MFGSDSGANKFKKTYFNGFVDISGGDIILRDGSIFMSDTSVFKKNNFNLIIPTLTSNDYLVTSSSLLNYQTISGMSTYLTTDVAATKYQPIVLMSNYLTLSAAVLNYQTISGMNNYLTKSSASLIYQTLSGLSNYLTKSEASSTYVSSSFAILDTPTITSGSASGLSISTSSFNGGVLNNAEIVGGTLDDAVLTNITANTLTVNSGILNGGSLTDVVLHNSTSEENLYFTKKTSTTDNAIIWQEQNGYDVRGLINCDYFSSKMRFNLDSTYMPNGFEFQNGDVNIMNGVLKLNGSNISTIYQSVSGMSYYVTSALASSTYHPISLMSSYLTTTIASSTYQTIADMSSYLTSATASSTYQSISLMTDYLTAVVASSTYQTISNMSNYITTALATKHYTFAYNTATQSNLTVTVPNYSSLAMASTSMRVGMGIGGSLTAPVYGINRAGNYRLSVTLQCSISTSPSSVNIYYYKNNVLIPNAGALFFMGHYYGTTFIGTTSTFSASNVQSFAAGDLIIVRILAATTGVSLSTSNGYSSSVFIQEL